VARKIFDLSIHCYQVQSAAILSDLCKFFLYYKNNSIKFWECSSYLNWHLHKVVDKETKAFNLTPLFPCKTLYDFSKKRESGDIINIWKMTFQASDLKEKQFLDLLDNNNNIIKLSYIKEGFWLKTFGYSNSLCVYATRAITNHTPIGKYRLKFFPKEEFKCPYGLYSIKSRYYIVHECGRFNGYWNLRRDSLSHVLGNQSECIHFF